MLEHELLEGIEKVRMSSVESVDLGDPDIYMYVSEHLSFINIPFAYYIISLDATHLCLYYR